MTRKLITWMSDQSCKAPLHTRWDDPPLAGGAAEKLETQAWLVGTQDGAAAVENSWQFLRKVHRVTV